MKGQLERATCRSNEEKWWGLLINSTRHMKNFKWQWLEGQVTKAKEWKSACQLQSNTQGNKRKGKIEPWLAHPIIHKNIIEKAPQGWIFEDV